MLTGKEQSVGEQAGFAGQCPFGGDSCELRMIVAFGEMGKDEIGRGAVVNLFEKAGGGIVGEMADAGENALLDGPGIWAVAEHFEIVIRLQHDEIAAAKLGLHIGGHVAEVGGDGETCAFGGEDESNGIGGVVWDSEGADGNVADGEGFAGTEVFDGW